MEPNWTEFGIGGLVVYALLMVVRDVVRGFFAWKKAREERRAVTASSSSDGAESSAGERAQLRLELREDRVLEQLVKNEQLMIGILKGITQSVKRIEIKLDERNRRFAS